MKKIISILLVLVMVLGLFCACGSNQNEPSSNVDNNTPNAPEEPYEVRMIIALPSTVPAQAELDRVMAAINEITLEELNMTLKLEPLPFSVFTEQVNLELSSGAKLDLVTSLQATAATQVNAGYLVDLEPLLAEYGKDIVDTYVNESLANR